MTLYAPNHNLTLSGGLSTFYGSFIGYSVTVSGGAHVHYDDALGRAPRVTLASGSWTEIMR